MRGTQAKRLRRASAQANMDYDSVKKIFKDLNHLEKGDLHAGSKERREAEQLRQQVHTGSEEGAS